MEEILKRFNFQGTWEQLSSLIESYGYRLCQRPIKKDEDPRSDGITEEGIIIPITVTSDWPGVGGMNEPVYAVLGNGGSYRILPYWNEKVVGNWPFESSRKRFSREFGKSK